MTWRKGKMQAIILLGGKGTRLSRLYPDRPKALVPVAGRPFLERQLAWLAQGGVTDIHLAAGHQASAIQDWMTRNTRSDVILTCSTEPSPLGTGGGLKSAEAFIRSDPFLVLNGDSLMPQLDFQAFQQSYLQAQPLMSLAVTRVQDTGRYGTIEFDAENRISAFHEKTERKEGWVNGGVYLMNRQVLAGMESDTPCSLEVDLFPRLARQGLLLAFPVTPPLLDMGTPEGLAAMERYFRHKAKAINHRGPREHGAKRYETL